MQKIDRVKITPYDPNWPHIFEKEALLIRQALADNCIAIHHVGSTSVPGLAAKPKIDIIAVVRNLIFDKSQLEAIGYKYRGGFNIPLRRSFTIRTAIPDVFLHGDLHHDNILQNGENWLVIDPKGVIGEPAYEVAAFIRNPIPELLNHADAPNIIHNRVIRFAELFELPPQRILDWCFVQAVLSWVWAIEDGCDTSYFEHVTKVFNKT